MEIKHPIDLLASLGDLEYGMWDHVENQKILWDNPLMDDNDYLDSHCYVQRPAEVYERRMGTCWDICLLAYAELSKLSRVEDLAGFYVEYGTGDSMKETHAGTTYKYNIGVNGSAWYWFEYFHPYYGVNGPYFSKEEMDERILKIEQRHIKTADDYLFINPSFNPGDILSLPGNITHEQFVKIARGNYYKTQG